jgi:hypothetical protein
VALVGAIAVVVIVGVFAAAIVAFHLAARRTIDQSQRRRQVEYLAGAGIEFALAELLAGAAADFQRTYEPLENAEVRVELVRDEQEPENVRIVSEATLTRENRPALVRQIARRYRLVRGDDGKVASCEFVAFERIEAASPEGETRRVGE